MRAFQQETRLRGSQAQIEVSGVVDQMDAEIAMFSKAWPCLLHNQNSHPSDSFSSSLTCLIKAYTLSPTLDGFFTKNRNGTSWGEILN